jgi:WD repeat-containing protein 55
VTGSSDGLLRLISLEPNKLLGVVGEHSDLPVEALELSRDRKYIVSASHDNKIKFWNIEYLYDDGDDEEEGNAKMMDTGKDDVDAHDGGDEDEDGDDDRDEGSNNSKATQNQSKKSRKGAFFSGLE